MGMIMHDDVPYGEGTSYTQGTGIAINNNIIAVDADNTPTENSEKPVKSKGVSSAVKQIYADNGVLGAKNLLKNEATSQTINGVTFTVNADKSVTVNGTATATAQFNISFWANGEWEYNPLKILSGCPKGGSTSTYYLRWIREGAYSRNDIGDGVLLDVQDDNSVEVRIIIISGYTANNLVFKPMIRLASDPDDTYVPYAMTNRELTEDTQEIKYRVGILSTPVPAYVARCTPPRFKNVTDDWENGTLRDEIAAGNFKNVVPCDYLKYDNTYIWFAEPDGMLGKSDQTNATYQAQAYGQHHIYAMVKYMGDTRLWTGYGNADKSWRVSANDKGRCPWNAATDVDPTDSGAIGTNNTNITRTYNSANVSGYMGSFIRERMDAVILPYLQTLLGSANVLLFRNINGNAVVTDKPSGGQGNWNGCTSGWGWYDRYLDLPSEVEIYGSRVFGSAYDIGVQCEQLAMFKNARIHDIFPKLDIWTKAVASSSFAASCYGNGSAVSNNASVAVWACPLVCIR